MVLRWDCETECVDSRGVVCDELTNSVSLGSERRLKRWELLTTSVCMCACASRRHIWQTWRNNNAGAVSGSCPWQGVGSEHDVWFFSDEQRTRDDAPYRCAHANTLKHDTCTHTCWHAHPPGPWYWICAFTSDDTNPSRAGSVNKTKKKLQPGVFLHTVAYSTS